MHTIIAGSRTIDRYDLLAVALHDRCGWTITRVLCGDADGVGQLAQRWAAAHDVPCDVYEAERERYGDSAGPRRNAKMACNADALVALWDGESPGTKDMIEQARKHRLTRLICETRSA